MFLENQLTVVKKNSNKNKKAHRFESNKKNNNPKI